VSDVENVFVRNRSPEVDEPHAALQSGDFLSVKRTIGGHINCVSRLRWDSENTRFGIENGVAEIGYGPDLGALGGGPYENCFTLSANSGAGV